MTGKRYYLTTLGAWHRHAARFTNSHWLALANIPTTAPGDVARDDVMPPSEDFASAPNVTPAGTACCAPTEPRAHPNVSPLPQRDIAPDDATPILVLVEADEGAHLALEDDVAFEALPHPLAQKPVSETAQTALATHGVAPGATTFDASEAVARVHPLLRHRVF
jgi:hypothetical protein